VSPKNGYLMTGISPPASTGPTSPYAASLISTRPNSWARDFVHRYNFEHQHCGISYATPVQRHAGEDVAILAARHQTYLQARARHSAR